VPVPVVVVPPTVTTTTDGEVTVITPTTTTSPTPSTPTTPSVASGFVTVEQVEDSSLYFAALILANLIVIGLVGALFLQLLKPKV
jgi:hypothetical protein